MILLGNNESYHNFFVLGELNHMFFFTNKEEPHNVEFNFKSIQHGDYFILFASKLEKKPQVLNKCTSKIYKKRRTMVIKRKQMCKNTSKLLRNLAWPRADTIFSRKHYYRNNGYKNFSD